MPLLQKYVSFTELSFNLWKHWTFLDLSHIFLNRLLQWLTSGGLLRELRSPFVVHNLNALTSLFRFNKPSFPELVRATSCRRQSRRCLFLPSCQETSSSLTGWASIHSHSNPYQCWLTAAKPRRLQYRNKFIHICHHYSSWCFIIENHTFPFSLHGRVPEMTR